MKNVIAERVYDFLKNYPPFSLLEKNELINISNNVIVQYIEEESTIFQAGEKVGDCFYVVREGAIGIYSSSCEKVLDKCGEGDIFGLRALIRKDKYTLCATALEESILYSISSDLLENILEKNPDAKDFIYTSFSANDFKRNETDPVENFFSIYENNVHDAQMAQYSKNPVTCDIETTIKEAAQTMAQKKIGSIVITKDQKPVGIITDKDFRMKIATGKFNIEETVDKIMSSPLITFKDNITVAEAQINLIKHNISHLCITNDGTQNSELKGILSEHDIIVFHGNNPSVLIKELKRAENAEQILYTRKKAQELLKGYLEQKIPVSFITKIISEINEQTIIKSIELAIEEMKSPPPVKFGFLALGSMGRNEQLLLTDQDSALIYENPENNKVAEIKKYFISLAERIVNKLKMIGYEYCPAEMMANNPKWCLSLDEWTEQFDSWISVPTNEKVMLCTIFFDYHLIYGSREIIDELTTNIYKSIEANSIFLNFLAKNATENPPPLSFFRNFLVEASGEHKNQFDIKARAIMPLVDAARLLVLSHNVRNCNNTIERYEKLVELEPQNKELYESCIVSFKTLLLFKTLQGMKHSDSGRFVDLESLSKRDKLKLRSSFKPIKELQELIKVRFRLNQLN